MASMRSLQRLSAPLCAYAAADNNQCGPATAETKIILVFKCFSPRFFPKVLGRSGRCICAFWNEKRVGEGSSMAQNP